MLAISLRMKSAAFVVDVEAVRAHAAANDFGAELFENQRRDFVSGAVRAIERDR